MLLCFVCSVYGQYIFISVVADRCDDTAPAAKCAEWAENGACEKWAKMEEICIATCGFCKPLYINL